MLTNTNGGEFELPRYYIPPDPTSPTDSECVDHKRGTDLFVLSVDLYCRVLVDGTVEEVPVGVGLGFGMNVVA